MSKVRKVLKYTAIFAVVLFVGYLGANLFIAWTAEGLTICETGDLQCEMANARKQEAP